MINNFVQRSEILINRINNDFPGLFKIRPDRDSIWVDTMDSSNTHRAVRHGICRNPDMTINHMAYLRHAGLWAFSFFYRYVVPTGQTSSAKSLNP